MFDKNLYLFVFETEMALFKLIVIFFEVEKGVEYLAVEGCDGLFELYRACLLFGVSVVYLIGDSAGSENVLGEGCRYGTECVVIIALGAFIG